MQYEMFFFLGLSIFVQPGSINTKKYIEDGSNKDLNFDTYEKSNAAIKLHEAKNKIIKNLVGGNEKYTNIVEVNAPIPKHNYDNTKHDTKISNKNQNKKSQGKKVRDNEVIEYNVGKNAFTKMVNTNNNLKKNVNTKRLKRDLSAKCIELYKKFVSLDDRKPEKLNLTVHGTPRKICVRSSDRAPSKAFAALLVAAIRYRAGYDNVFQESFETNLSIYQVVQNISHYTKKTALQDGDHIYIYVDADWNDQDYCKEALPKCDPSSYQCSIAGPRLTDVGRAPAVNIHLYAALSNNSLKNESCVSQKLNAQYINYAALDRCDFLFSSGKMPKCIPVRILADVKTTLASELTSVSFGDNITFCNSSITKRRELKSLLKEDDSPFLFIDYDLDYEKTEYRVRIVQLPPHLTQEPVFSWQVADTLIFQQYAPYVFDIINLLRPQPKYLREILEVGGNYSNAACTWASNNNEIFKNLTKFNKVDLKFLYLICKNNESQHYVNFINDDATEIIELENYVKQFSFKFLTSEINCEDKDYVGNFITTRLKNNEHTYWKSIAGIALPGSLAGKMNTEKDVQVVYYDVPPSETSFHGSKSVVSGNLTELVRSICYFLRKNRWSRIGVISEDTTIAKSYSAELQHNVKQIKEETLVTGIKTSIANVLEKFQKNNVKVFFVNTGHVVANSIICEAAKLQMAEDTEYAWIMREWQPHKNCERDIQVFTVSYWWRGGDASVLDEGNKNIINYLNDKYTRMNRSLPILVAPIMDATLLMLLRTEEMIYRNSSRYFDLHLEEPFSKWDIYFKNINGVVQKFNQKIGKQSNPLVFVSSWSGDVPSLNAVWRVQSDTLEITEIKNINEPYSGGEMPEDYKSHCITTTSADDFNPFCHDPIWFSVFLFLVVVSAATWKIRRNQKIQETKEKRQTLMRLLSRCEKTAAVLEPYLIDRLELQLYEELGSGHFGRVRFGMVRASNRSPIPVAAKTLREDAIPAEEAEFLREASTMATLSHDHIVRLVGVCADADGPPLLLMDHAFFGDLLKYLRQRRHLVEVNERDSCMSDRSNQEINESDLKKSLDPEAHHVSSAELTRLGREAAEGLDFLGSKYLLHRDVRAANCLVDARRVLKLADFGMARNVEQKNKCPLDNQGSEDYKYVCRRRGVFPVSWMAPESLDRGEFSRASDVWALGVLMLEISTLGARPYGSWKPLQVLRYVRGGGRPPLPRDASYHACEVIEMCWNELPSERATAKKIAEYLLDHPTALRGALKPAWPEPDLVPDSTDSGFGEKEDQEWSKGVDLRVSTL